MRVTWATIGFAGCVSAVAVSGCGLLGDHVHDEWQDRTDLPSCGTLSLDQAETPTQLDRHPEVACLQDALVSGKGAELRLESPTVEGDKVTEYYRVTEYGTTEVYVDSTKDENSDQKWSFSACDKPENAFDVNC